MLRLLSLLLPLWKLLWLLLFLSLRMLLLLLLLLLLLWQLALWWLLLPMCLLGLTSLVVLSLPMIGIWIRLLSIPYRHLFPAIVVFLCIGVYSVNLSVFDVLVTALIGGVGYFLVVLRIDTAALLLGFVLGPMMEEELRRAMLKSSCTTVATNGWANS